MGEGRGKGTSKASHSTSPDTHRQKSDGELVGNINASSVEPSASGQIECASKRCVRDGHNAGIQDARELFGVRGNESAQETVAA